MSSKENCKESVLKYLRNQNRPYSANDVMQNLHKEFGKTAIQKALDDLTFESKIKEKVYGKQKVYSVIQEEEVYDGEIGSDLQSLDSNIDEITEKLNAAEQELKASENVLKELESQPTTEKALQEKNDLEKSILILSDKVETLSQSAVEISKDEKNKIYSDFEKFGKESRKRKRICMEIINSILENYPKKMKVLLEEIGIETDEDIK